MVISAEMVKLTREARGLTIRQAAQLAGMSAPTWSRVETGSDPGGREESIAAALGTTVVDLQRRPLETRSLWYRKRASLSKKVQQQRQALALREAQLHLADHTFDAAKFDNLRERARAIGSDSERAERAAELVRSTLGLRAAPVRSVLDLLSALGALVVTLPAAPGFDAQSFFCDGVPVIAVSRDHSIPGDRLRLTLLHELGHLLLHAPEDLQLHLKQCEREANSFAGATLLPTKAARRTLTGLCLAGRPAWEWQWEELIAVKVKWGISLAAMIFAARRARLIEGDDSTSAFKHLSYRGWRTQEPGTVLREPLPAPLDHLQ